MGNSRHQCQPKCGISGNRTPCLWLLLSSLEPCWQWQYWQQSRYAPWKPDNQHSSAIGGKYSDAGGQQPMSRPIAPNVQHIRTLLPEDPPIRNQRTQHTLYIYLYAYSRRQPSAREPIMYAYHKEKKFLLSTITRNFFSQTGGEDIRNLICITSSQKSEVTSQQNNIREWRSSCSDKKLELTNGKWTRIPRIAPIGSADGPPPRWKVSQIKIRHENFLRKDPEYTFDSSPQES